MHLTQHMYYWLTDQSREFDNERVYTSATQNEVVLLFQFKDCHGNQRESDLTE